MAKIYLSSTYTDLKTYREAVYHVLRKMSHDVIAMEDYVATDQRPLEKCMADVAMSDLYIGIFAWCYGYIPPEKHKSITELEYRQARQIGKTCLLFLLDEEAPWPSTAMDALSGKGNRGECIQALRDELTQERMVSFFKTPEELASLVGAAVHLQTTNAEKMKKEERLRAMLADHTGFLQNRLTSFVGREQELADIRRLIAQRLPTGGYITITGQAGQGKSSIIAKLVDEYGQESVPYHFIPFNPGPDHQVGLMRNLMARLILRYDLPELYVASESRPALRDYFTHVLADVSAKGGSEVIFLDGLDQLEEDATGARDLSFLPTNPPPGIVFVLGTRPNDTLRPLELLKPFDEYELPNLSRKDFDRIQQHRHVTLEHTLADRLYLAVQENALYLDLVAQELAKAMDFRPEEIIERVASNPENLFSLSMSRLKRQRREWREVIKPVLGVLLAAREPFSLAHIRPILHLEADQLKEGIERLGGLVSSNGSGRYSLFHLKFYDYLRQDERHPKKDYIFAKDEEEQWHQRLADWCEQDNLQLIWDDLPSNGIEQERRVYARKHFIAHLYYAQDWHCVFAVLDAHSFGQMKVRYDPSTRSFSDDLDLGRRAAASENWTFDEGVTLLPRLWRYTLLRCSLASRADRYPEAAFWVLMVLDREQEALGLAELLTNRTKKANVLIIMAEALEQQQKGEEIRKKKESFFNLLMRAHEVAGTIEDSNGRAWVLRKLGEALAHTQDRERAFEVWAEAERVIATIDVDFTRIKALRELVGALAYAQEWAEAERVIATIEDSFSHAAALSKLGEALAQAQETERAFEVWAEAERVIASIENNFRHTIALSKLGEALAHAQEWAEAERVIATIEDKEKREDGLHMLGAALAHTQEWAEAERVIATIEDNFRRTLALSKLGEALVHAQKWAEAERVIAGIKFSYWRILALSMLAAALAQAQETERAFEVWAEAEQLIATIEDSDNRAAALSKLGEALAHTQDRERAFEVWAEAEQLIATIEDSDKRADALRQLGTRLTDAQEWAEAERVIATIEDSDNRAAALRKLGEALVQAQERERALEVWAEAERVIATIEDSDKRADALRKLGEALAHAQERKRAAALWAEAERVIATIQDGFRHAWALRELGEALAHAQEWAEAERVIATIEDSFSHSAALSKLGEELIQAQEWTEAERVIATIKGSFGVGWTLNNLGEALAQAQDWAEAERVIATIKGSYERAAALRKLGAALAQVQDRERAFAVWAEAERVIATIKNDNNRIEALSDLGEALAQAQEWAEAERVIATIGGSSWGPLGGNSWHTEALRKMGAALTNAKNYLQLLQLLQSSLQQVTTRDNAVALLSLAYGLLPLKPEIGFDLLESFSWVDDFFGGKNDSKSH